MIDFDEANTGGWRFDAPVFAANHDIERQYPNGDKLPGIWITEPVEDGEGIVIGRNCVMLYPSELVGDDIDGEDALYYGACYYDEAMEYIDPADHEKRVECFQAAELLYRHAAGRGNAQAYLSLGYVYSYDRCEGRYWQGLAAAETGEDGSRAYPHRERALECFSVAAEADITEACYKLGDMYKHGIGCDLDAAAAYKWYSRASNLAMKEESPVVLGSVALRLGGCFEEGFGCEQSFSCALQMYGHAVTALDAAVDMGETWYENALANARAGAKRCKQEIAESR